MKLQDFLTALFWIVFWVGFFYLPSYIKIKGLYSTSKKLKWLRKLYWNKAKIKLGDISNNYKVEVYFYQYISNSIAVREHFINNGLQATRMALIPTIESIEKFVEKYRYNTFDNLDPDEEKFIEEYEKKFILKTKPKQ
jgi:hypothetical protein